MARAKKAMPAPLTKADLDPLLTDQELAALLKVKLSWVQDAAKDGRLPCTFLPGGKLRRYTPEHYRQIVAMGERSALNAA